MELCPWHITLIFCCKHLIIPLHVILQLYVGCIWDTPYMHSLVQKSTLLPSHGPTIVLHPCTYI